MNHEAIELGPISISLYSICILIGILCAYLVIDKQIKKNNLSSSFIFNMMFWIIIFGIIGARIYYVLFNLDYYLTEPIEIFEIWKGGLAIHGGVIAGFLVLLYFCKKYYLHLLKMLDITLPALLLAQAIGRWGNFFNGECYGKTVTKAYLLSKNIPSFIIKGMKIEGFYRTPLFLYESLFCVLGYIIILFITRFKKLKTGFITSIYLIWYGILRLFIESSRTDSLMLGDLKVAKLVSIIMIVSGLLIAVYSYFKSELYEKQEACDHEIRY